MLNSKRISVALVFYNTPDTLKQSINSVLESITKDDELILVDDSSDSVSKKIATNFAGDSRVRILVNLYNEGVCVSRNRSILSARGEYVAIQSPTETASLDRFEKQFTVMSQYPEIVAVGGKIGWQTKSGKLISTGQTMPKDTLESIRFIEKYHSSPINGSTVMFRKTTIIDNHGYTSHLPLNPVADFEIWSRIISKGYSITNLDDVLVLRSIFEKKDNSFLAENMSEKKLNDIVWGFFNCKRYPDSVLRMDYFNSTAFVEHNN